MEEKPNDPKKSRVPEFALVGLIVVMAGGVWTVMILLVASGLFEGDLKVDPAAAWVLFAVITCLLWIFRSRIMR